MDQTPVKIAATADDKAFLKKSIEDIERKKELIADLRQDISDIFKKLKGMGHDVKAIKQVLKFRAVDFSALEDYHGIVEIYFNMLNKDAE